MAEENTSAATQPQEEVPQQPEGTYSLAQLKEHGTRESLWMLLHDKVYDITAFMDEHPGGDEVLIEEAGRDATEAFEDVGHSDEARDMLPKMLLGDFYGEKTNKSKRGVSTSGGSSSASGFPIWVVPVAFIAAFLAWRVFLA